MLDTPRDWQPVNKRLDIANKRNIDDKRMRELRGGIVVWFLAER
jgi:hypothetical protein